MLENLKPLNRYLQVEIQKKEEEKKQYSFYVPEQAGTNQVDRYSVVKILSKSSDCQVEVGNLAVVPTHGIEDVEVDGVFLHFVTDNYLIATWS
jgi:hypothetical protein